MKKLLLSCFSVCVLQIADAQINQFKNVDVRGWLKMIGYTINGISNDSTGTNNRPDYLITEKAAKAYARSFGGGGGMVYPGSSGIVTFNGTSWGTTITDNSGNWNNAYTDRLKWDGGSTGLNAATGRTSLGATTVGGNFFTLSNPSAVTFPRVNADNSISMRTAAQLLVDIGAVAGNIYSIDGTQTDPNRNYFLGYGGGSRSLSIGKSDGSEKSYFQIYNNSTTGYGGWKFYGHDSSSSLQFDEINLMQNGYMYRGVTNGTNGIITKWYKDSLIIYTGLNKLRYNFGRDTFLIKGQLPVSSSTGDSVMVIDNGGVIKKRAQSDISNSLPSQTGNGNKFLQTDGTNASWQWTNSSQSFVGGGTYNLTGIGYIWQIITGSGTTTLQLPTAVGNSGLTYGAKNVGGGTVTFTTALSQTIDGLSSLSVSGYALLMSDGSNWKIISQSSSGAVSSVFGRTGAVVATSGDYTVTQITGAAPSASPTLTGTVIVPNQSPGDSSSKAANTAYVDAAARAAALKAVNDSARTYKFESSLGGVRNFYRKNDSTIHFPSWVAGPGTAIDISIDANGDTVYTVRSLNYVSNLTNATDANFTAQVNTRIKLPNGTLTANRTITMPTGSTGDIIEIYNRETVYNWNISGSTIYLSDETTTVSTLLTNTYYSLIWIDGKWQIKN